jgi:MFS family permease
MDERDAGRGAGVVHRTLAALWTRNFRLFFIGQLVSNSGNWLTIVALTLLILHRTGSGFDVGLLSACQFGPILLLSAFAGLIADRSDKRRLLYVTQTLEMLQSAVLAVLAFDGHAPTLAFYGTALAGGCMLAFDNPVRRSFVNQMVSTDDVPNAVTLYSAMVNLSRIVGPALGGLLIVTLGFGWCFTIDAASYVCVLVALVMMRIGELRPVPVTPRGRGQVRAGLRYVAQVPDLWITFTMLLLVGTISYNFTVVFPLFVEKGLHGNDASYTIVYSLFSAGSLLGAVFVARRTAIELRHVIIGAAAFGLAMLMLGAAPGLGAAYVVVVLVGASSIVYMTSTTAIAQVRSDPQMIGRVLALQTVLLVGTTPVGGPLLGLLADVAGARSTVYAGAVGALVASGVGARAVRRVAARRPPEDAPA